MAGRKDAQGQIEDAGPSSGQIGVLKRPDNLPEAVQDWYLGEKDIADFLGVSVSTLQLWRRKGEGPPWAKIGKRLIRYRKNALLEWAKKRETQKEQEAR